MITDNTPRRFEGTQFQLEFVLFAQRVHKEIAQRTAGLHDAYGRRHKMIIHIFDQIERNPSIYTNVTPIDEGHKRLEPMTLELLRSLRQKYEKTLRPLAISGPGCDDPPACAKKANCICVFGIGTICCYICLSPAVIQCD